MATDSLMSNAILAASLRAIIPEARRVRARFLSVVSQIEKGAPGRVEDEADVYDLYSVMATVREISRSGEMRLANAHRTLWSAASGDLRKRFQQAYNDGAKDARFANDGPDTPPLVNHRPSCCPDAARRLGTYGVTGDEHWNLGAYRIKHCPFCGARLPEVTS